MNLSSEVVRIITNYIFFFTNLSVLKKILNFQPPGPLHIAKPYHYNPSLSSQIDKYIPLSRFIQINLYKYCHTINQFPLQNRNCMICTYPVILFLESLFYFLFLRLTVLSMFNESWIQYLLKTVYFCIFQIIRNNWSIKKKKSFLNRCRHIFEITLNSSRL